MRKVPALFEEDFSYIFEKYMFEDEEYASLFNISIFQINYLKLLHKKGNGDIQDFLNDTTVPESMKERVGRVFRKRIVFIDGECVPLKREIILQRLLKAFYSDKECTTEEFEKFYSDFLAENGLDNNESLLFPNSRAFEARIIDYPYSLYKLGKRIRYYDTSAVDINDLLIQIGIEQYNNTEISTLKLVRDSAEIMDAFDIRAIYILEGNTDYYYDGVFEIVCRGQYIKANSADEFWSKERSKNIISGKEMEIQGSNTSTNPKEFIQRRGRILRNAPGKKFAYIYDFIVIPTLSLEDVSSLSPEEKEMELKIISREFEQRQLN